MGETHVKDKELYEEILAKITALWKGFLIVADKSIEKACSFARGLLIFLEQLSQVSSGATD